MNGRRPTRLIAYRAFSDLAGKAALFVVTLVAARRLSQDELGVFGLGTTAGWIAAVGYLAGLGEDEGRGSALGDAFAGAIRPWEAELTRRFLEGARAIEGLALYGIDDPERVGERTPTFAIRLGEQHPLETASALGERGIYVWDGHYYALELMERLGLQPTGGAVRIGFCHYNTPEEVDRVLEALAELA